MMKLIFTLAFTIFLNIGFTQTYWVSAISGGFLNENYDCTQTSDGGVISVGTNGSINTYAIKFNAQGEVEWNMSYPTNPEALIATGIAVVEGDESFFIGELGFAPSSIANIIKIDKDGNFEGRYATDEHDINELMIDRDGNLLAIFNDPFNGNINTLKKLDQDFNLIWETDLSLGRFSMFDGHAYVDENNEIQLWMEDSLNNGKILRLVINSDGEIITQDSFPTYQPSSIGILHGNLEDSKAVYVAAGGNVNGTTRTLALVDLETQEEMFQRELSDDFFWVTDLSIFDAEIYVLGQYKDGNELWSEILVLDDQLNILNKIELKELVLAEAPILRGISAEEMTHDSEGNLLITGHLLGTNPNFVEPTSSGYLTMYLNPEGKLENISSVQYEDFAEIELYPNPSTDHLWIEAELESISIIEVYNNLGQKIQSLKSVDFPYQLNTADYQSGQYFLVLGQGQNRMTRTFIKK